MSEDEKKKGDLGAHPSRAFLKIAEALDRALLDARDFDSALAKLPRPLPLPSEPSAWWVRVGCAACERWEWWPSWVYRSFGYIVLNSPSVFFVIDQGLVSIGEDPRTFSSRTLQWGGGPGGGCKILHGVHAYLSGYRIILSLKQRKNNE